MLWHYRLHSPNLPYLTYGTDLVKTKTKADKMPIVGGERGVGAEGGMLEGTMPHHNTKTNKH